MPVKISRRALLVLPCLSFLALLFKPFNVLFASDRNNVLSGLPSTIEIDKLKFFKLDQAELVDEISSQIIPSDKVPGAREAGVVYEIDRIVAASQKYQGIYTRGLAVLDSMAAEMFSKEGFMSLKGDEKTMFLKVAETGNVSGLGGKNIHIDSQSMGTAILFFALIKEQTFGAFYSGIMGWKIVGYHGPPQWKGNRDYHRCA
ncbi:MAG: gluconate 2-dehydrogenase subunit 3 family protein [Nitrospiraceae bacterium]|nr:MAG: gluconate 2-dehydrogenase subunit 3 family protein [Nitrospiraceae bacterium]